MIHYLPGSRKAKVSLPSTIFPIVAKNQHDTAKKAVGHTPHTQCAEELATMSKASSADLDTTSAMRESLDTDIQTLWDHAYRRVQAKDEDLVAKYESLLLGERGRETNIGTSQLTHWTLNSR